MGYRGLFALHTRLGSGGLGLLALTLCTLSTAKADGLPALIRVSVFPHTFKYSAPQQPEKKVNEAILSSSKECRVYPAENPASLEAFVPRPDQVPVSRGKKLRFHTSRLQAAVWVLCDAPAKLVRESGLQHYTYDGSFLVEAEKAPSGQIFLRITNFISLEGYLRGVVPSEMPASWPAEALKAQAIAARTFAVYELLETRAKRATQHYDVDDTVFYQAYEGLDNLSPAADAAITATTGQVITYRGEAIRAYFHANSGGHTEDARNVWGVDLPYALGKPEPYGPEHDPTPNWNVETTLDELTRRLGEARHLVAPPRGQLLKLRVIESERTKSGRAGQLELEYAVGKSRPVVRMPATVFAYILRLRSTFFSIEVSGRKVRITGRGYGHGAGMSQVGARIAATVLEWDAARILAHYYEGTELGRSAVPSTFPPTDTPATETPKPADDLQLMSSHGETVSPL